MKTRQLHITHILTRFKSTLSIYTIVEIPSTL